MLGLDGFPHRAIGPELTPRLWDLARRGGRAPNGGVTDLPSSTDPGFCSLLTGCKPATHGVLTTSWRFAQLPDWAGAQTPRVPAIFDACRAAGVRTAAIVAGIIATALPGLTVLVFVGLLAAWALVSGVLELRAAFNLATDHGRWWLALGGIISIVFGIVLVAAPMFGALVVTWWVGAYATFFGATLLALGFKLRVGLGERLL